jgi:hypothetical protein
MKAIIFIEPFDDLGKSINDWLKLHKIKIEKITQPLLVGDSIFIVVFYTNK